MNIRRKYRRRYPEGDIVAQGIIRVYSCLLKGVADTQVVFNLFSDEDVKRVLDDDDYAIWVEKKNESLVVIA